METLADGNTEMVKEYHDNVVKPKVAEIESDIKDLKKNQVKITLATLEMIEDMFK